MSDCLPLERDQVLEARSIAFRVWGLGFGVWGLGFGVKLVFRVWGLGLGFEGFTRA